MDTLKAELQDSFIKPLRFKFMVERLKRESSIIPPPEKGESEGVTQKGIPHNGTPPNLPLSREE
ncbi:MAG: hypothetical protein WAW59_00230 [Patescibacteria group bacterium]